MSAQLAPGDRAPDFTLDDAHGNRVSLDDLRGRRTIVYFYPKAFTPGCTTEACDFRDHQDVLAAQGHRVVGISADSPQVLAAFASEHDLDFTLLSDPGSETARAWGAWGQREIDGVLRDGPLRTTVLLAEDGTVLSADYGVEAGGHVASLVTTIGLSPREDPAPPRRS